MRSTDFAPGASRPVIRGLSGPRVQVLTNGIGLIDASSVSPDHQVATDPAEANRIEIVRGPATLAYGGTAIGEYEVWVENVTTATPSAKTTNLTRASATATTATVTGLTNGGTYYFRISAITAVGTGTASANATCSPSGSNGCNANGSVTN
jgi:iron complex outermembrane receptor protein